MDLTHFQFHYTHRLIFERRRWQGTRARTGARAEASTGARTGTRTEAETGTKTGAAITTEKRVDEDGGGRCLSTSGHTDSHALKRELPCFPRSNIIICSARKSLSMCVCECVCLACVWAETKKNVVEETKFSLWLWAAAGKELTLKHLSTLEAPLHTALVVLSHRSGNVLGNHHKSLTHMQTHM